MHAEHSFLFDPSIGRNLNTVINDDNKSNIYGRHIRFSGSTIQSGIFVYKRPDVYGTQEIKNFIKNTSYHDADNDPYIELIRYFSDSKLKAMKLRAADFAYLKDIGVYPINRLWILRRYPDTVVVPDRPADWGENAVEPISTVIGWMKDEENNPMISLSFGETWIDQTEMIDKVIGRLMEQEFGQKISNVMSVPGWGQGILFGMLEAMDLTADYSANNVPTGDPNVLRISKMRETESQSLKTDLNFKLETCYEQKYINGIDPGSAFLDIIGNLLKMGTSDQRFIISSGEFVTRFLKNVNNAGNAQAWLDLTIDLVKKFIDGIGAFFNQMKSNGLSSDLSPDEREEQQNQSPSDLTGATTSTMNSFSSTLSGIQGMGKGLIKTILIGTVSKYRWPLRGSISLMTGLSTTPWHLTIGNPYSPIVNIANIVVRDVKLNFSNDLGFNDLPIRIDVSISAELGRPLGKQEIEKIFNNGYKRVYAKTHMDEWAAHTQQANSMSASGQATQNTQVERHWSENTPTPTNPSFNPSTTSQPVISGARDLLPNQGGG